MKKHLSIIAVLTLVAIPVWGQSWQADKAYFLGEGRSTLMTDCDIGRKINSLGFSKWDQAKVENLKSRLRARGSSASRVDALLAGQAAAMAEVCPDVW